MNASNGTMPLFLDDAIKVVDVCIHAVLSGAM